MIIPLGHEEQLARRWPWVSVAIIVLSFLGWAFLRTPMAAGEQRVAQAQGRVHMFARSHPQAHAPGCRALSDAKIVGSESYAPGVSFPTDLDSLRESTSAADATLDGEADQAADGAQLARLCAAYENARGESIKHRLGYVPGRSSWLTLISYQFVDDSFLHLVFGMWFLWLAGAVLEDGWGRVVYPLFYLSGGICAAIFYKVADPQTGVPLLGASGGVAAAVGAFLVRHPKAESKMLIWFRFRPRVVSAPAFVMVGLWLGVELIGAMFFSLVQSNAGAWAQFIGFGFGMLFAAGMRFSGAEKRLDDAIEQRSLEPSDPRLDQAKRLIAEGQSAAALTRLQALASEEPFRADIQRAVVDATRSLGDQRQLNAARARLIELHLRGGEHESAWQVFEELTRDGHGHVVPPRTRLRLADHLANTHREAKAIQELASLYAAGVTTAEAAEALVCHAELMVKLRQRDSALALFEIAQRELGAFPLLAVRISAGSAGAAQLPAAKRGDSLPVSSSAWEIEGNQHPAPSSNAREAAAHSVAARHKISAAAGDIADLPPSLRDLPSPIKKP